MAFEDKRKRKILRYTSLASVSGLLSKKRGKRRSVIIVTDFLLGLSPYKPPVPSCHRVVDVNLIKFFSAESAPGPGRNFNPRLASGVENRPAHKKRKPGVEGTQSALGPR